MRSEKDRNNAVRDKEMGRQRNEKIRKSGHQDIRREGEKELSPIVSFKVFLSNLNDSLS